jgi:hypothetical protein
VTYTVYSDDNCQDPVSATGLPSVVTVTDGVVANSASVTLPDATYYWRASYSGDSANDASSTACGSEIEVVQAPGTTFTLISGAPNPSNVDAAFTVTANECNPDSTLRPTGTMSFTDTTTNVLIGTMVMGTSGQGANCGAADIVDTEGLATGTYQIQATYIPGGTDPVPASTAVSYTQTVSGGA